MAAREAPNLEDRVRFLVPLPNFTETEKNEKKLELAVDFCTGNGDINSISN